MNITTPNVHRIPIRMEHLPTFVKQCNEQCMNEDHAEDLVYEYMNDELGLRWDFGPTDLEGRGICDFYSIRENCYIDVKFVRQNSPMRTMITSLKQFNQLGGSRDQRNGSNVGFYLCVRNERELIRGVYTTRAKIWSVLPIKSTD